MDSRLQVCGLIGAMLLASCSAPSQSPGAIRTLPEPGAQFPVPVPLVATSPARSVIAPLTLEGYKKEFAHRVVQTSPDVFHDPLPKVLKSIVVLDVTIDRDGKVTGVKVQRSNGYRHLETIALNSVRRAAPFAAPSWAMRRSDGSVNFLETFLFRDDGRFQIRTLAGIQ